MRIAAELRAVDMSSSHQFEEEIGASSSENRLFIPKMEFSVRTPGPAPQTCGGRRQRPFDKLSICLPRAGLKTTTPSSADPRRSDPGIGQTAAKPPGAKEWPKQAAASTSLHCERATLRETRKSGWLAKQPSPSCPTCAPNGIA